MDARPLASDQIAVLAAGLKPLAERNDRLGRIPSAQFESVRSSGLLALTIPRVLGGAGATVGESVQAVRQLAAADPAVALILAMHWIPHLVITRTTNWPKHLARKISEDALAGRGLINALRVEPQLGSPSRGGLPATTATRTPEGWRITGHKIYSTGAVHLDWYLVWARTSDEDPLVGAFLVKAGLRGVRIDETWDHAGMRASGSHDVLFDSVLIPADHAIELRKPDPWLGADPVQASLYPLLIGAVYDGIAHAARDWIVSFVRERQPSNLGASLATLPRVQEKIGGIEAILSVNERLLRSFSRELDELGVADPSEAGVLKRTVTNGAIDAVEEALRLAGNHGLSRHNPLERHYRDVLCGRIHAPQDDSTLVALGRHAVTTQLRS